MSFNRALTSCVGILMLAVAASAFAQPDHALSAQQRADLAAAQNFKLTERFLKNWEGYSDEAAKNPCKLSPMLTLARQENKPKTLEEAAKAFDAQPGVHAALARHNLTAREALLGMMTLMSAAMQDLQEKHPEMVGKDDNTMKVSAANMAFYRKHAKQFEQHRRKVAREQFQRNGGKLPACLRGSTQ